MTLPNPKCIVAKAYFQPGICFLLLLFCLLLDRPEAAAQLPGMRKYTLTDGYTATNGYVVQQDQKGFIWLGTENGALRFDGKKFQVMRDKRMPADQEILSCNPYGKDQVLLVPLLNNISYYKNGEVISAQRDRRLNMVRNKGRNSAFLDHVTGNIWINDESALSNLYCFSAKDITRFDVKDTNFQIVTIRNNVLIGYNREDKALRRFDLKAKRYRPIYDAQQHTVHGIYVEQKEDGRYIFMYNTPGDKIRIYAFANDSVLHLVKTAEQLSPAIFTDKSLNLWFKYLDGGISYVDKDAPPQASAYRFMDNTVINYLFVDREKNIWITGQNNSLYFLSDKHFRNALRVQATLPGSHIPKCISGDASASTAISYINKKLFAIRYKGRLKYYQLTDAFYEGARCICPLGNGRFLIMDKDLALIDGRSDDVKYFHTSSTYKDMYLDKDGGLLVACLPNAFYLEPGTLATGITEEKRLIIFEGRTSSIAALADGTILVGTPDGLFVKKDLHAPAIRIDHPELSHTNITDIADKGKSGALLSTNGQGIYYYNALSGKAEAVKVFPGAGMGQVHRIFKQNDSMYWLSTGKGAYEVRFGKNAQVNHIRNYTFYDGLPSNNITSVHVQNDTAFITTAEGPGIIPLRDTTVLQMAAPQIFLNSIVFRDTTMLQPGPELELSYQRNDFQVSLSAISFESFGNIRYYYKMEGLADEWTETDIPEIRFAGLAPGVYLFKAYASNAKGVRSKLPVTIYIHIQPAFWQTLAFKTLLGLLILLLLYVVIRRRTIKLALGKYEKARQQRRLAELELEAIKAQINPHFIYNCLNSIQYFNYEKRHDEARQYLDLFARLIRLTMQYSRETFISIAEETDYLGHYLALEKMRFDERLQYQLLVAEGIDEQTMIPAMLIQPYVENALKHGIAARKEGGHILIRFELPQPDLLLISIEDDGTGFDDKRKENKGSLGLRLSGSRAETYNQLFGMKIEINFYNKKNYHPDTSGIIVQLKIPLRPHEHAFL